MDRPVTSKSRGICRYYTTPRGCFAGDYCKFLHGANEKLSPYDKAKVCRYYAKGYCTRGDKCWFRHVLPKVAVDDERIRFSTETCCICLEKPKTYGLLTNCSHVFCLECIRQWRAPAGKSPDMVISGTIKCCPLCRTHSRFVAPSAHFFPDGSPCKKDTIDAYKASMARVPCRYFEETLRNGKPCCPFGIDCFYRHTNPDGTLHVFCHGAKHSMNIYRRRRLRGANLPPARFDYDDPVEFLQHIFDNPITNLHATLDVIRASLPAFMEGFELGNEHGSLDSGDEGEEEDEEDFGDFIDPFELLGENSDIHDEAAHLLSHAEDPRAESSPERAPSPTRAPVFPETGAMSERQPVRPSSRFSTAMDAQSRQTFIIEISDDDEEEEEEDDDDDDDEPVEHGHNAIDASDASVLESTPVPHLSPGQPPSVLRPAGNVETDVSPARPQCEHDADPPFVTDGRGRVVWSSTRNASGRGNVVETRARHPRTGSAPRAYPPAGSTHVVPNARGWGGQDAQGLDGKVGGGEDGNDVN